MPLTEDHESYFFRPPIAPEKIGCISLQFHVRNPLQIQWMYKNSREAMGNCTVDDQRVLLLESSILLDGKKKSSQCFKPLTESFLIWVQGDVIIMWTCQEEGENEHDEGALFLAKDSSDLQQQNVTLDEIQSMAKKYFDVKRMNHVTWAKKLGYSSCMKGTMFVCKEPAKYNIKVSVIFAAILGTVTFLVVIHDCISRRKRRIIEVNA